MSENYWQPVNTGYPQFPQQGPNTPGMLPNPYALAPKPQGQHPTWEKPLGGKILLQATLIVMATSAVVLIGLSILLTYLLGVSTEVGFFKVIILTLGLHAVVTLLCLWWLLKFHKVSKEQIGAVRLGESGWHLLWQIPLIVTIAMGIEIIIFGVFDAPEPIAQTQLADGVASVGFGYFPFWFIGVAIFTPLWEELFFRGIFFNVVRNKWGLTIAVLITSVVFALAHMTPVLIPYLFILGVAAAILRNYHGSLVASVLLHMTVNSIASAAVFASMVS